MKSYIFISSLVIGGMMILGAKCSPQPTANILTNTLTNTTVANTNDGVVRQHGIISTYPLATLPLIDKVEVFDSIRNTTDPKVTAHEIEYVSNTGVADLYAKFNTLLTGEGWTEQNPQTQTVGTIQMMTGTFVKAGDTISIAVQTAVGDEKQQGTTKAKLKIEQTQ